MTVRYRRRARDDIESICRTIARDNLTAAEDVRQAIRVAGELLGERPELGVVTDEKNVRRWPMPEFHYTIFYLIERDADRLDILRVMDGKSITDCGGVVC